MNIYWEIDEEEDRKLYEYGFHMLFAKCFFFALTVLLGFLLHIIVESIVFFFLFSAIRSYAGGVHANKESACTVLTSEALLVVTSAIKFCIMMDQVVAPLSMILASTVIIMIYAPLDSPEKPLDQEERERFRRVTYLLLLLIVSIAIFALVVQCQTIFCACAGSLGLEGMLLLAGHLKRRFAK